MDEPANEFSVDAGRTYSEEWNLEKEMAASENVEDLRLELSKDEDDKLFAEVSDVFGRDDATTTSAISEQEYSHNVDNSSPIGVHESPDEQDVGTVGHKRSREEEENEDDVSNKKPHLDDDFVASGDEEVEQSNKGAESDEQLADLHDKGERLDNTGEELYEVEEDQEVEAEDLELEREAGIEEEKQTAHSSTSIQGISDFDLMMQRRKEAMQRARRRKRKDCDVTTNDDEIMVVIDRMRQAANEDKQLNLDQKAATKKLKLLPVVLAEMNKSELKHAFVECGALTVLTEWLRPLPDHSLPHVQIREGILDLLCTMPSLNSDWLKQSGIGKAVMMLYRHPKETRKNKEKAGKLINEWARPIFGLTSDLKTLSREERENRDYEHLSAVARRRLSSSEGSSRKTGMEDEGPQKPGDKGWIGRARVPMPSHKDYVVRPSSNVSKEGFSKGHSKKTPGRYEKHMQKVKDKKSASNRNKMHAATLSIEGRGLL